MSKVTSPSAKKRLAYTLDHYNRNGENNKAWRKIKPSKKAKARRAFRRSNNLLVRLAGIFPEDAPVNVLRRQGSLHQRRVCDWGAIRLREFVATRPVRNQITADCSLPRLGA